MLRWRPWMKVPLLILGLIGLVLGIWIGLPMIGWPPLSTIWLRALLTVLVIGPILIMQILRWRKRRAAARELENALTPAEPEGDGAVLTERMNDALVTLKKSGGASYLYDLPWYVIIGPPGAGKTTALRNSGIEFPLSNADDAGVVSGFGGTRYCDWWFAEDAILIDTAGRYTTQDSDKTADESSWQSFLELLKKSRPNQPINGVILAFSIEDMMTATPEELTRHSEIVRARLAEVHEKLRIDFPVYVLFTKCDLISGFREYFSSFSVNRRKGVWGVTFQTKDRKAQTHEQVPDEFDKLVSRLSDEIIDRLTEEPDGISRIAIFGLPGQMALLRDNVSDFLRRVFEPTRYKTSAILRGFYFTSGTQEGTPIDQVLGAMAGNDQAAGAFAPAFMSGQGKSFFLYDLLRKVIFEERDWVSHDVRAVRHTQILRAVGLSVIGLTTVAALTVFGVSFWQNRALVQTAQTEARAYEIQAQDELARTEIDDRDLAPILPHLQRMRMMPAGFGDDAMATRWQKFGLGQRGRIQASATDAYADSLETMLRPRLILDVENRLPQLRADGEPSEIYRALKVYMLLAGQGARNDDEAVKLWFDEIWRAEFGAFNEFNQREQLTAHLDAMLSLDDTRDISVPIDDEAIRLARNAIVRMSLADQAYAIISDRARANAGLEDLSLIDMAGSEARIVFVTRDGSDLSQVGVPGLFTYEGYWSYFFDQLSQIGQALEDDKWVLGEQADAVNYDEQLAGLERAVHLRYQREFEAAWETMFDQFELANLSADKPRYDTLGVAASPVSSPLLLLAREVDAQTYLVREIEELAELGPEALATGNVSGDVGQQVFSRFRSRSSGIQRILVDSMSSKSQARVNGTAETPTRDVERLTEQFAKWHDLMSGPQGQRPIDVVLGNLQALHENFRIAQSSPAAAGFLPQLISNLTVQTSRLPDKMAEFMLHAEEDFRNETSNATIEEMNAVLNRDIAFTCQEAIATSYPFANTSRQLALSEFGRFFSPGGELDRFFNEYLAEHVTRTTDGLQIRPGSALADRLSPNAIRQFDRAERIRRAFFGSGGTSPEVAVTVRYVSGHSSIDEVQIMVNGEFKVTGPRAPAVTFNWPETGTQSQVVIFPANGSRETGVAGKTGPWSIIDLMQKAQRNPRGNAVDLTYQIGGRSVTLEFTFNAINNPFTMPELQQFSCPQSVD